MFPAASILYSPPPQQCAEILAVLVPKLSVPVRQIESQGFASIIPQVLVEANPPFVLQPEEQEFVAEDIDGLRDVLIVGLTTSEFEQVRMVRGLVDVFGTRDPAAVVSDGVIAALAQTSIDVRNIEIESLIFEVADLLGGWLVDHVTPGIRGPGERFWRDVSAPTGDAG